MMQEQESRSVNTATAWAGAALLVVLLAAVFYTTRATQAFASANFDLISLSLVIISASLILLPATNALYSHILNSLFSSVLLAACAFWLVDAPASLTELMRLAAITFSIALLLFSLQNFISRSIILLMLVTLLLSPLWSSPLLDNNPTAAQWINPLLAINPLTHLAIAIDFDYLRQDWLYRHSAFGSLPFRYPGFSVIGGVYLLLILTLQLPPHWVKTHKNSQGGNP